MRTREHTSSDFGQRILGAVDLAIDLATLGEYGLEHLPGDAGSPVDGRCRERRGHQAAWEAFAAARRGGCTAMCARPATHAARLRAGFVR